MPGLRPGFRLLHGFNEDQSSHVGEEPMLLGQTEKLVGEDDAVDGVLPANQALDTHYLEGGERHLRLIVVDQFPLSDGGAQLIDVIGMAAGTREFSMALVRLEPTDQTRQLARLDGLLQAAKRDEVMRFNEL